MSKRICAIAAGLIAMLSLPSLASAEDYAATALNIIPSGQLQPTQPPAPLPNDTQATMYDGLTPLFDQVSDGRPDDLLQVRGPQQPRYRRARHGRDDPRRPGDHDHPRLSTACRTSRPTPTTTGIFAAGWIAASDRSLLLNQARYNARVAAIDAPGLSAIGLVTSLQNFVPSQKTEDVVAQQTQVLKSLGKEGKKVLADIDTYLEGINDWYDLNSPADRRLHAQRHLRAERAQGSVPRRRAAATRRNRTQFLSGLQDKLGSKKGAKVFDDLRQFKNKGVPTTVDGKFPYGKRLLPNKPTPGNVIIDHDSYERRPRWRTRARRGGSPRSRSRPRTR